VKRNLIQLIKLTKSKQIICDSINHVKAKKHKFITIACLVEKKTQ